GSSALVGFALQYRDVPRSFVRCKALPQKLLHSCTKILRRLALIKKNLDKRNLLVAGTIGATLRCRSSAAVAGVGGRDVPVIAAVRAVRGDPLLSVIPESEGRPGVNVHVSVHACGAGARFFVALHHRILSSCSDIRITH